MNDENITTSRLISAFDQYGTAMENIAAITGAYYLALIKSGIKEKFAQELVLIWFSEQVKVFIIGGGLQK